METAERGNHTREWVSGRVAGERGPSGLEKKGEKHRDAKTVGSRSQFFG
jgi:hypothetical protein